MLKKRGQMKSAGVLGLGDGGRGGGLNRFLYYFNRPDSCPVRS